MPEVLLSRLRVTKIGLYPNACFLSVKTGARQELFLPVDQLFVALHGHWVGGGFKG